MKTAYLSLLGAVATAASLMVSAAPSTTDEARAEVAQQTRERRHAESLRPLPTEPATIQITDSDSARLAAGRSNARRAHDAYLEAVLLAGTGSRSAPIKVSDTDSARAAAAQKGREDALLADYASLVKMQAEDGAKIPISAGR